MDDLLTGQIGLISRGGGWVSRGIEWVTRSPYHHVIVGIGNGLCIGAESHGATIRPVEDFPGATWSRFDLSDDQRHAIVTWCLHHVGTPYNWLDDAAIGVALVFGPLLDRALPRWVRRLLTPVVAAVGRRLSRDDRLECAQLADAAYEAAGIHLFTDGRLPGAVYPGSFGPIFAAHGWA